jgi:ribosomal protein S18 acetylase RimI-like enzyme
LEHADSALFRETMQSLKPSACPHSASEKGEAKAWLAQSANILIAALHEDTPVGFALGYLLDRVDGAAPMLFLYEIEVTAAFRRRGIGSRLVEAMKDVARNERVVKMWVQADPGNDAARALYQRTGGVKNETADLIYVWFDLAHHGESPA